MNRSIREHFKQVDPILFAALQKIQEPDDIVASSTLFTDLCDAIISQQLSNKVAAVLVSRVKRLLGGDFDVARIMATSDSELRAQGISFAKIRALKDLSRRISEGSIDFAQLKNLSNEAVIESLVQVQGIGPWTAEMFLMFSLGREDVFSVGDGGLRRAVVRLYGMPRAPTKDELLTLSEKWTPYRSYAARILWRTLDQ